MFPMKKALLAAGLAVLFGVGVAQAQTGQPGTTGQGMGPGMMSQGGTPWCPGCGMMSGGMMMMGPPSNLNLSVADVKANLERWLSWQGNPRLKIGNVAENGGTITADIVTSDNSLVQRLIVDRNSGAVRPDQ